MDYYKPLANLNEADTVEVKQIGEPEDGKYGKQHQCSVKVNGDLMTWTMSEDKLGQFYKAGFKEGDTVLIQKWKEGMKKGYNFKSPDKENAYSQPAPFPVEEQIKETIKEQPKDEFQDKMSRGASWNNAFMYCLKYGETGTAVQPHVEEFCKEVAEVAEKITKHQSNFVNND